MELTQMVKMGEILRRHDGDYCFSCNHCGSCFDVIREIIDHMNKVVNLSAETKAQDKIKLADTEFIDVTSALEIKCELIEDDSNDQSVANDLNVMDDTPLSDTEYNGCKFAIRNDSDTNKTSDEKWYESVVNDSRSMTIRKLQFIEPINNVSQRTTTANVENQRSNEVHFMKCCWCSETFNEVGMILDHFTEDHNKKPSDVHSCDECRIFFKNIKLLGDHTLVHHGRNEYEQFQKANEIESSRPIQCAVCAVWTYGNKSLDAHTKQAHKMYRILQCYICGIFKKKPSGLLDHLKVHDRFRKYRCYDCDNVEPKITNPNDFRSHKCVLCDIWFVNHTSIRNHITDVHAQDQIYDCSICDDYTFKTEFDLKMHNTDVHKLPMDYKCKYCSKFCNSVPSLKEHQKSHLTKNNTNLCTICGAKFWRKDYLSRHIKSHGEVNKDYTCYICKKQFQSNGYLKNHVKRHLEKKMYQCDVCGNRFLLAGLLRKHMRDHDGEIWKCDQCHKEFSNKSKLTAHEKTHVTERNFQCDVCLKSYKTSKNLRQHKLVHSSERRIKCRICNMTFNGPEHILHFQTHTDVI